MTPERWKQIEAAFDAAMDAAEGERDAVLERVCGDDRDLCEQVRAMVAAATGEDRVRSVVAREACMVAEESALRRDRKLGSYRLVAELGRGGMGAVYRAERCDEYRTEVAIKLLPRGLDTTQAIARFRDERQILATLEHPNIVRLLDGGTSEDGLPYLVMEYVRGVSITRFARDRGLGVRERVALFRDVCRAVQYAHQRLVVHRDLKPSNILVTNDATPKLLDFGIAKLLDSNVPLEAHTRTGMQLLTPEYASPEQARGEAVSTSTDVYSLGAILYELLADAPAHRLDSSSGLAALKIILEVTPPRPSIVAPPVRRRDLSGDLDNIIGKALAKTPRDRYASAEQLADDLRRYLDGLPVEARAPTWSYRAGKFVRRNRVLVVAAAAVTVALAASTAVSLDQARRADVAANEARSQAARAQRRFNEVRELANTLLFDVDDAIRDIEGSTTARELIVTRALTYLDRLAKDAAEDAALTRDLAYAYMKVGDVQGNPRVPNLGRAVEALESYAKAAALLAPLAPDDETQWARVRQLVGSGAALAAIDLPKGRERTTAGIALGETLRPRTDDDYLTLARAYLEVGQEDTESAARDQYRVKLLAHARSWVERSSSTSAHYWLAVARGVHAQAAGDRGDPETAIRELHAVVELLERLSAERPEQAMFRRDIGFALSLLATYHAHAGDTAYWSVGMGDRAAAVSYLVRAVAVAEQQRQRERTDTAVVALLADYNLHLALVLGETDPVQALEPLTRASELLASLPHDTALRYAAHRWWVACVQADLHARAGDRVRASAALAAAAGDVPEHAPEIGPFPRQQCQHRVARAYHALGNTRLASELLETITRDLRAALATTPDKLETRVGLAVVLDERARQDSSRRCQLGSEARAVWADVAAPSAFVARELAARTRALASCRKL